MEKRKRNLLFLAVILAGALIAVYGENRYISYAGIIYMDDRAICKG